MAASSIFRIPVPKRFLMFMSLRVGAELATLTLLINKASGVYGILALFTGFHLSPPQLSMYLYSIAALILATYLAPASRSTKRPFQAIGLAWLFLFDSIINAAYTAAFGASWFLVLARHNAQTDSPNHDGIPGGKTINDAAGFTSPEHNVSRVDVVLDPAGPEATLVGHESSSAAVSGPASGVFADTILQSGSIASITVISLLWLIRFYFILIMFAYARASLRQHIVSLSTSQSLAEAAAAAGNTKDGLAENPFASHMPDGRGLRGKLGRIMTAFPRTFWLGADEDGDWVKSFTGSFYRGRGRDTGSTSSSSGGGTVERERRRRAGTGPPAPDAVELERLRK